jgi:hypothetical protein
LRNQGARFVVDWYDGTDWHTVNQTVVGDWTSFDDALGAGADNNPAFKIRFQVDANMGSEYANIDNVEVTGG